MIFVFMNGTEKSESSYYSLSYRDRLPGYHVVVMEKVTKGYISAKYSKCNISQVISDVEHDFINFNALRKIQA